MQIPFFVRQNGVLIQIDLAMVTHLQTKGNYTKIFLTGNKNFEVRCSLSSASKRLPGDIFIQINRKTIASVFFIEEIAGNQVTIGGKEQEITKQYYASTLAQLNIIE